MSKLFNKEDLQINVDNIDINEMFIKKNKTFRDVVNVDNIQENEISIVELFNKYDTKTKSNNGNSLREYFDDVIPNEIKSGEKVIEKHFETIIEKRIEVEKEIDYEKIIEKISSKLKNEQTTNYIFNYIGELKFHPDEAKKGDIYRNYVARTTYIYDGKDWQPLIKDGNDGGSSYGSGVGPQEARRIVNEESELNIVELNISDDGYNVTPENDVILCNVSSGSFDIYMHPVSTAYKKKTYIKRLGNTGNNLGINSTSAVDNETIEGQSKITIDTENQSVTLVPKGINWYVL